MPGPRCWGIYRELAHSPGRETDDAEILRAVAARLEKRGFEVELKSPDELPESSEARAVAPSLFVMCERVPLVARLAQWERHGVRVVNRPEGIRNTDRERTIALLGRCRVPFPVSHLVSTGGLPASPPLLPCWLKRGDVHATEAGDVVFVETSAALSDALARFDSRGIDRAVVQEHVPGDLIKFYGVSTDAADQPLSWFEWFYHRDQKLARHPFDRAALQSAVSRGAAALGLDVFGGDAIVREDGRILLIDLNAWPSFALYRDVAAEKIAGRLEEKFRAGADDPRLSTEQQWPR